MDLDGIDLWRTIGALAAALLGGGGAFATLKAAARKAGLKALRFTWTISSVDVPKLERLAELGREAELRVAQAEAARAAACAECQRAVRERDELALRIAMKDGGKT